MASEIVQACPGLTVLSGDDALTLPILSVGGKGVISVVSNLAPAAMRRLVDLALAGEWDQARSQHETLSGLATGLLTLEPNPVGVKSAMKMLGRDTGALRLPLAPAADASIERIGELLNKAGLRAPATA